MPIPDRAVTSLPQSAFLVDLAAHRRLKIVFVLFFLLSFFTSRYNGRKKKRQILSLSPILRSLPLNSDQRARNSILFYR